VALACLWLGCEDGAKPAPEPVPQAFLEPEFSLVDVNSNSATHTQACSPRQELGKISAWYFGHAT